MGKMDNVHFKCFARAPEVGHRRIRVWIPAQYWLVLVDIFINIMRNNVKNASLDLYILLKSAFKMQKIPFHIPKIQKCSWRAPPGPLLAFSVFGHGWRCNWHRRCPALGNFNYVAPLPLLGVTMLRHCPKQVKMSTLTLFRERGRHWLFHWDFK